MKVSETRAIELWIKIVGVCVAIFGVTTYFVDRFDSRSNAAKSEVLQLVSEYYDGRTGNHRLVVFQFWRENELILRQINESALTDNEMVGVVHWSFMQADPDALIIESIYGISEFYDRVGLCVSTGVCDAEAASDAFCADANSFREVYGSYLTWVRSYYGVQSTIGEDWVDSYCS